MSKKGSASQPAAPDPTTVDAAQTQSNENTAAFNQKLNMVGTSGPDGSVMYQADPSQPGGYTQVTSLSPGQQAIYNQQSQAEAGALGVANSQIGRVGQALGTDINPSSYGTLATSAAAGPMAGAVTTPTLQTSFGQGAPVQTSYGQGGQIQTGLGSAGSQQAISDAQDAAYKTQTQYLDPQFAQQSQALQAQMAAQGLNPNDLAWQNQMQTFGQQQNQAYAGARDAAVTAGQQEQNTLYGQALNSGQFANSAQAQQNQENAQAAALNNSGAAQQYTQNAGSAGFYNQAASTGFNNQLQDAQLQDEQQGQAFNQGYQNATLGNTAQQQAFQQGTYAQTLPVNELATLMGLGQVSAPSGISYTPSQANSTNVGQNYQNSFSDQEQNYQTAMQQQNSMLGGLFGLGSAAIKTFA